jgi:hypothetical protein
VKLNIVFSSKEEAEKLALNAAKKWIDNRTQTSHWHRAKEALMQTQRPLPAEIPSTSGLQERTSAL